MAYKRTRKVAIKKRMLKRRRSYKKSSAMAVAKSALRRVKALTASTQETKFLSYNLAADLVNNGSGYGSAIFHELTSLNGKTALFNSDPVTGNKVYMKGVKGTWEIHMDNVNNEEETCNFTVAVIQPKSEADSLQWASHISTIQGQTYFDPRIFKIHYYKHFTRTMGGTSPGTAGEMLRWGKFYVPMNKLVRFVSEGVSGAQTGGDAYPSSVQDRYFFCVFTDNTAVDTESPRINFRTMTICRDADVNT